MLTSILYFVFAAVLLQTLYTSSNSQLTSDSANEGVCLAPPAQRSFVAWTFIFGSAGPWYVPMAHKFFYRKYAETLLNRPAADDAELAQMNLILTCAGSTCVVSGFQNTSLSVIPLFDETCIPTRFNLLNPALVDGMSCLNIPLSFENSTGTLDGIVLWTDSSSAFAIGLCINGKRAFAVFSKVPELSQSSLTSITSVLGADGYDSSYYQNLPNW